MNEPSFEQQTIISFVSKNNNVIVDSVAGSGKTTTILHIGKHEKHKKILNLTYNSKLKIETREKIEKYDLSNIETHSYHSFCVKYYDNECYTDTEIIRVLKNNKQIKRDFSYNLIIIDETQDMTPIYYELFCKIYFDNKQLNNINAQICIFGDEKQSIFGFNGADERFITMANTILNMDDTREWKKCKLSTSFRITQEMSQFVNQVCIGKKRILSTKISNFQPEYVVCNSFNDPIRLIKKYLEIEKYKPDDIFILAPSLKINNKSLSPVRTLENKIKTQLPGIPVYVSTNDNSNIDKDVIKNKLVFLTFHQSKGLERKVVFVMSFDSSYTTFFNKNIKNNIECPNEIYVAITRASERLILIHSEKHDYLPFLNTSQLTNYTKYINNRNTNFIFTNKEKEQPQEEINNGKHIGVVDLLNHLSQDLLNECFQYLTITVLNNPNTSFKKIIQTKIKNNSFENVDNDNQTTNKIENNQSFKEETDISILNLLKKSTNLNDNINNITHENELFEDVSDINGLAMQFFCEHKLTDKIEILNNIHFMNDTSTFTEFHKKNKFKIQHIDIVEEIKNKKIEHLLQISNCWSSYKSGYVFRVCQINRYDWLTYNELHNYNERFLQLLNDKNIFILKHNSISENYNIVFEQLITSTFSKNPLTNKTLKNFNIQELCGYIDFRINKSIFELKFVSNLNIEHYLQLALYMYLFESTYNYEPQQNDTENDENKYYLYNFYTNELVLVSATYETLEKIFTTLINKKYTKTKKLTDNQFLQKIIGIKEKYKTIDIIEEKSIF